MALMLVRLLIIARLLPVEEFAVYSLGLLVSSSFCMLGCLGLQSLLQRDLPVMIVRGREIAGGVLLMQNVLVAIFTLLIAIAAATLLDHIFSGILLNILLVGLVHGLSQQLFTVITLDSRSRSDPIVYANQNILRSIAILFSGPLVVILSGGSEEILYLEIIITAIISLIILLKNNNSKKLILRDITIIALRRLPFVPWNSAIILLLSGVVNFASINIDRWIAAQGLEVASFAEYAFASTILLVGQSAQSIINASVFPALSRNYALNGKFSAFSMACKLSFGIFIIGILVSYISLEILYLIMQQYFIKYININIILPFITTAAVFRLSDFWTSYLIIIGNEKKLLFYSIFNILISLILWLLIINFDIVYINIRDISILAMFLSISSFSMLFLVSLTDSLKQRSA